MKHTSVIPEIFSLLDTALLSAYLNDEKDPAQAARKWLVSNHKNISTEAYKLLTSFGVKKKGFNIYLKKWLSQYAERRSFIVDNQGTSDKDWVLKLGRAWEAGGGVFFDGNQDDGRTLSPNIIKAAQAKGVVTLLNSDLENHRFLFELAMSHERHYHGIITHFDKYAVPVLKTERTEEGTILLHCSSPNNSHLNKLVLETSLPFYAKSVCKIF